MILVTRINGHEKFYVNEDKIEFLEATPDTIISLDTGKKIVVSESVEEVIAKMIEYKSILHQFRNQGNIDNLRMRRG